MNRREWDLYSDYFEGPKIRDDECIRVREVLPPDDPDPEWANKLIRLCELSVDGFVTKDELREYLATRGDK